MAEVGLREAADSPAGAAGVVEAAGRAAAGEK